MSPAFVGAVGSVGASLFTPSRAVATVAPRTRSAAVVAMSSGTVVGNASRPSLGLEKFDSERIRIYSGERPDGFSADYEEIISNCYRFVFGNAYIMESERAEMAKFESEFRDQRMTVKEFCRAIAKTEQYKMRFFDNRPLYGAIEMNFKHFLGRTPDGLEQYRAKSAVYDTKGYESFVDAFFDDGEYDASFDDYEVPFLRGHLTTSNLSMAAFTHVFQVVRGSSTSDKSNRTSPIPLNRVGIQSIPKAVIPPGTAGAIFSESKALPGSWANGLSGGAAAPTRMGSMQGDGRMFRVEVTAYSQDGATNGAAGIRTSRTGRFYPTRNNSSFGKISSFRSASKSLLCSYDDLSKIYQKVHKQGGKIASITAV